MMNGTAKLRPGPKPRIDGPTVLAGFIISVETDHLLDEEAYWTGKTRSEIVDRVLRASLTPRQV